MLMTAEIFTMIHGGSYYADNAMTKIEEFDDIAFGFSIGQKYISYSGFVLDSSVGIGRNMNNKKYNELVLRLGISFGYRF